jgi:hypothetical protein
MNDDELITLVREQRHTIPLDVPVEEIISRGQAVRARRLIPGVAGMLALATGVAIAVVALTPATYTASHPGREHTVQPAAHLTAWTVTKLTDGNISVTIRQLQDPTGLQSTLRADGVPASVTFAEQLNPACQAYPASTTELSQVFPTPYQSLPTTPKNTAVRVSGSTAPSPPNDNQVFKGEVGGNMDSTVVAIDPSSIPNDAGVQLAVSSSGTAFMLPQMVYASSECTGS